MEALHDVVRAGKARYIGASSMYAWQFAKAQHAADEHGWTRFVSMQNHYNLVYREEEREMIPQCIDQGVGVIPWSPLARGFLTGNRTRDGGKHTVRADTDAFGDILYTHPTDFDVVDRVAEVAAARGASSAQVGAGLAAAPPGVTAPIVGATKVGHLEDALAAEQLELTAGGDGPAGGAVRAPPHPRPRLRQAAGAPAGSSGWPGRAAGAPSVRGGGCKGAGPTGSRPARSRRSRRWRRSRSSRPRYRRAARVPPR